MPREQSPEQQQYQKGLTPDHLVSDDEDIEDGDDAESDVTNISPIDGDQQQAQDEGGQRPDDNIDQVEGDDAEDVENDEDESDHISQRP